MKTTWLTNKWIWSVVVVALFAIGCGESLPTSDTTNCLYNRLNTDETISYSVRANCGVSGNVLTLYDDDGEISFTIDKDKQQLTFYSNNEPESSYAGTVTVSSDGKTWKYIRTRAGDGDKIILDADVADTTDPGSTTNTGNCTYKTYSTDGTLDGSTRMNCEVSGNVLTAYNPSSGKKSLSIDKDKEELIGYAFDGSFLTSEIGTVTVSADKKTWTFVSTEGNREELVLD